MIIQETNPEKAKMIIKKSKPPIIVQSTSDAFSRTILEYGKFQILLLPKLQGKDKLKRLDSGLNHVMAKIATKNNISIGIDISEFKKINKKEKSIQLAKIKQNIKICRKAKCQIKLLNYNDEKNAKELLTSLGASSQQTKQATTF